MRIIIDGFNKTINKRDNQIVIKENGKEIDYFLPKDLKQIIILGKGTITFDAIALLADANVDLIAVDWRGNIRYRLASKEHNNVQIRKQQYFSLNDTRSGYLAKKFIESKILTTCVTDILNVSAMSEKLMGFKNKSFIFWITDFGVFE